MFLVGHVTKEGAIAGPRVLEHMVDAVLYLEGDRFHQYRLLRGVKNRFGSTNEVGVFEMANEGMIEVHQPLGRLPGRAQQRRARLDGGGDDGGHPPAAGRGAGADHRHRRRPAPPHRQRHRHQPPAPARGRADQARGPGLYNQDIYVNVVGGMKIDEPAVDLAVAVAIASRFKNVPVDPELALIGEIGLSGELRSVGQLERRLNEAAKLGFTRAIYPPSAKKPQLPKGMQGMSVRTLQEAIGASLTKEPGRTT